MSARDLRAAAFLSIADGPSKFRVCFSTDGSEEPTGIAPVCGDEDHEETDGNVYSCCGEPVIETGSGAMAAYLVSLINADGAA